MMDAALHLSLPLAEVWGAGARPYVAVVPLVVANTEKKHLKARGH